MTDRHTTAVIAHRGASRAERENTVAAFARARVVGADGVEFDVRRTADRALVVHHDAHLADGRAIVDVERSGLPEYVPTLEQAIDACDGVLVNIEIKNSRREPDHDPDDEVATGVVSLLARLDAPERWLISSFRYATIDRVRAVLPDVSTAWLVAAFSEERLARVVAGGHTAIHPGERTLTAEAVRAAHDAGVAVNAWTCNDPDRLRRLMVWGTDGVCTDVPEIALAIRTELDRS